jgi:hypothetical protein
VLGQAARPPARRPRAALDAGRRPHGARTAPGRCPPHPATATPPAVGRREPTRPAGSSCRTRPGCRSAPAPAPSPRSGAGAAADVPPARAAGAADAAWSPAAHHAQVRRRASTAPSWPAQPSGSSPDRDRQGVQPRPCGSTLRSEGHRGAWPDPDRRPSHRPGSAARPARQDPRPRPAVALGPLSGPGPVTEQAAVCTDLRLYVSASNPEATAAAGNHTEAQTPTGQPARPADPLRTSPSVLRTGATSASRSHSDHPTNAREVHMAHGPSWTSRSAPMTVAWAGCRRPGGRRAGTGLAAVADSRRRPGSGRRQQRRHARLARV